MTLLFQSTSRRQQIRREQRSSSPLAILKEQSHLRLDAHAMIYAMPRPARMDDYVVQIM